MELLSLNTWEDNKWHQSANNDEIDKSISFLNNFYTYINKGWNINVPL